MIGGRKSASDYEKEREALVASYLQSSVDNDARYKKRAKEFFDNLEDLEGAVREQILPSIVMLRTADGIIGTGYYQAPTWLVTNAHVVRSAESLQGLSVFNWDNEVASPNITQSFHRPYPCVNEIMPDIAIINVEDSSNSSLPTQFTGDSGLTDRIYFYIDHHLEIKLLNKISGENDLPMIFECLDGSSPQHGVSGSPILEARVLINKMSPSWQFKTVAALFARYNSIKTAFTGSALFNVTTAQPEMRICAIPVMQDFEQIRTSILLPREDLARNQALVTASTGFKDKQGQQDATRYLAAGEASRNLACKGLHEYAVGSGVPPMAIKLPPETAPLYGDGILAIEQSLLIRKNLKAILPKPKDIERYTRNAASPVREFKKDELILHFNSFVEHIKSLGSVELVCGDDLIVFDDYPFRVDCSGGGDNHWKLELQDNTGKGHKVPNGKASLSATFSIVNISNSKKTITGEKLSELLKASQEDKTPKHFEIVLEVSNTKDSAKKVSKKCNKPSKR